MKKTTGKKIIGGLMVAIAIATIGAVFARAETDTASDTGDWHRPFWGNRQMYKQPAMNSELTEEQQMELDELVTNLLDEGASREEIREAIFDKLDEFGVLDERLDKAIERTEQRLEILNRENELRDQGYSWDEIITIIQEEFVLENHSIGYKGRMPRHGMVRGFC